MEKALVDKLKKFFLKEKNVTMAFLFGSATKEHMFNESDIDIAVYVKKDGKKIFDNLWSRVENLVNRDVDLVKLNKTYATLAFEAIKGIRLKIEDESLYTDYMLKISQEAVDFQEFVIDLWRWKKKLKVA